MPNCSAITSGAWFGSITPPEPGAVWWYSPPDSQSAPRWRRWRCPPYCGAPPASSGDSRAFGKLSKIERVREGFSGRGALWDRRQIQHRKRNGFVSHNSSLCRRSIFNTALKMITVVNKVSLLCLQFQPGETSPVTVAVAVCRQRQRSSAIFVGAEGVQHGEYAGIQRRKTHHIHQPVH